MDQRTPHQQTAAETALATLYAARSGTMFARLRADAFEQFRLTGLPHRRVESYKYSDLRTRIRGLPAAAAPASAAEARAALDTLQPLDMVETLRIAIVNGRFVPELSSVDHVDGLTVHPLTAAAPEVASRIGELVAGSSDPLAQLNTALFDGGAVVEVAPGATIALPVELAVVTAGEAAATVMPRLFVSVGEGARVTLMERCSAGRAADSLTNGLVELSVGTGADVTWVKLIGEGAAETHLGSTFTRIPESAHFKHLTVTVGDGLSRSQLFATIAGADVKADFSAATVATGGRHADTTLVVRHEAAGSASREFFRSAVGSGGRAIVQGQIIVAQDAQKTDARMMSNGLFLDAEGEIINKPELEIFADDVQCGHGATSGTVDEEQIFYLRSRGVPKAEAERMLVEAFLLQALDAVEDEALSGALAGMLRDALRRAHDGGAR